LFTYSKSSGHKLKKSDTSHESICFLQLAKGLTRTDGKQLTNENGEIFSSRWHQHLSNSAYRPGNGKVGSKG